MSIRQGLPHIHSELTAKGNLTPSLSVRQFADLTIGGMVHVHSVTEKTDGMTFVVGKDDKGFFTMHSGSGNIPARYSNDHVLRVMERTAGLPTARDINFAKSLSDIHIRLQINKPFQQYLEYFQPIMIRGELLNRALGKYDCDTNQMIFVHTPYRLDQIGSLGSFILHSKLPENARINPEEFIFFGDEHVSFDHDIVDFAGCSVDVQEEVDSFNALDHSLIMSRTTAKNKTLKIAENEAFNEIKKRVSKKVTHSISAVGIENKWGTGSEGIVVHPSDFNPIAPRFKITTDGFKIAKANTTRF